ncbi:hypothetical protein ABPG75_010600 [Micractinium tetrahymenae]
MAALEALWGLHSAGARTAHWLAAGSKHLPALATTDGRRRVLQVLAGCISASTELRKALPVPPAQIKRQVHAMAAELLEAIMELSSNAEHAPAQLWGDTTGC